MQDAAAATSSSGYASTTRNDKLRLLARQKRASSSSGGGGQAAAGAAAGGGAGGSSSSGSSGGAGCHKTVRLSSVLQQAPQHFDSTKVAAVERMLETIDELPQHFQSAEKVYLSKNNLVSLEGVQQFARLRVLSAGDNLMQDLDALQPLAGACPNLQVASFERNPFTALPNYRLKVLQLLPSLQSLDGQAVSAQERGRVGATLQQEAACMAVMLSNACMVHKLARSAELLQLHTELRHTLFGSSRMFKVIRGVLPGAIPLDLLRFLRIWDNEGSLSAAERASIRDALTREVVRVHKQLQAAAAALKGPAQLPVLSAWDTAFSQVMLAQQRTIIQLVELVNVLHGEAADLIARLTGPSPAGGQGQHHENEAVAGTGEQQQQQQAEDWQEQQLTVDQRLAQDRENLILDLRDAALEMAGLIAEGETAQDAVLRCSRSSVGSGQQLQPQLVVEQQQMMIEQEQKQQQPAAFETAEQQQPGQRPAAGLGLSPGLQQREQQQKQRPARQRRSSQSSSHDSLRLRPAARQQGPAASPDGRGVRSSQQLPRGARAVGAASLTAAILPAEVAHAEAAPAAVAVAAAAAERAGSPQRQPQAGSPGHGSSSSSTAMGASLWSTGSRSPDRPLSSTARRLVQTAQQQQHQQQHQQQPGEAPHHHAPPLQSQQQQPQQQQQQLHGGEGTEWQVLHDLASAQHLLAVLEHSPAASTSGRPTGGGRPAISRPGATLAASAAGSPARAPPVALPAPGAAGPEPRSSPGSRGISPLVRSPGLVSPCSSPGPTSPATSAVRAAQQHGRVPEAWQQDSSSLGAGRQQQQQQQPHDWGPQEQSLTPAPSQQSCTQHQQQQQSSFLSADALAQLAATGVIYESIQRYTPVSTSTRSRAGGSRGSSAASRGSSRRRSRGRAASGGGGAAAAASAPASPVGSRWQQQQQQTVSPARSEPAGARQCRADADASACHQQEQLGDAAEQPGYAWSDVAAMAAAAEAAVARQLFADDGACGLYSPFVPPATVAAAPQQQQPQMQMAPACVVTADTKHNGPPDATPAVAAASDAVGMLELSELSGLSNPSPSSAGGGCAEPASASGMMTFNALFDCPQGEPDSSCASGSGAGDDSSGGEHYASARSSMQGGSGGGAGGADGQAQAGSPYVTRSLSQFEAQPGWQGSGGGGVDGTPGEISFALAGSRGSSPDDELLRSWPAAQQQERPDQQQQQRHTLLWELLQAEDDAPQLDSPASRHSSPDACPTPQQPQQQELEQQEAPAAAAQPAPAASGHLAEPVCAASASAAPAALADGVCGSSIGSFSSSMDVSPVKRQLFKTVSAACRSVAQGVAGLSSLSAQLGAAAAGGVGGQAAGDGQQQQQGQLGVVRPLAVSSILVDSPGLTPRVVQATAAAEAALAAASAATKAAAAAGPAYSQGLREPSSSPSAGSSAGHGTPSPLPAAGAVSAAPAAPPVAGFAPTQRISWPLVERSMGAASPVDIGAADAAPTRPVTAVQSVPSSPATAAAAAAASPGGVLSPLRQHLSVSLPASPTTSAAAAAATAPQASAAAPAAVRRSSTALGQLSAAALADLQKQLLVMAVEKAALQRQVQQERASNEELQAKACRSQQLEHTVEQMHADLQHATQLLEHTAGATEEQSQLNRELQEQMQQLQAQVWAAEADRTRRAAAETLARISLCRRVLRHFAAAAAASGPWRRLKAEAAQRGRVRVLRRAFQLWRMGAAQTKGLAALQQRQEQRLAAAVLATWAQAAWQQRTDAVQGLAAGAHFASRTCRRALALWYYYAQQRRRLGIELPSPSTASSCSLSECESDGGDGGRAGRPRWSSLGSREAAPSLVLPRASQQQQQQLLQQMDQPAAAPGSLLSLTERLGRPLSGGAAATQAPPRSSSSSGGIASGLSTAAPCVPAAGLPRPRTSDSWHGFPPTSAAEDAHPAGHRSISALVSPVRHRSTPGSIMAGGRQAGRAAVGGLSVPLALQADFAGLARAQRVRRRRLLLKAFSRWRQLLEVQAATRRQLDAAARRAAKRLQGRTLSAWMHAAHVMQGSQGHAACEQLLQQHVRRKQALLQLRVCAVWRRSCAEAEAGLRLAALFASQRQRAHQRAVLGALQAYAQARAAKRRAQARAEHHRARWLLVHTWSAWHHSTGAAHEAAVLEAQHSQTLLARAVCRWQAMSAALAAAAAADAAEGRLAVLQRRWQLSRLRAVFDAWRLQVLAEAAAHAAAHSSEVQGQLVQVQQQLASLPELQEERCGLQQQLAALQAEHHADVTKLQEQLRQAEADHQQQLAALQAEHHADVQAWQQQLEQQMAQQKAELELHAAQQQQRLDHAQHVWEQQVSQEQKLLQQLATRKGQCGELALQLKRCTNKLNEQTSVLAAVKGELKATQQQLAAARALSRDKGLCLTEKAVSAERGRVELQQQLAQEVAAAEALRRQVAGLQQQLIVMTAAQERERRSDADAGLADRHECELAALRAQVLERADTIAGMRDSMAAVQGQLSRQQAKVLAELGQLRTAWSQAKAIIKQQRRTIKALQQETPLQVSTGRQALKQLLSQPQQAQQASRLGAQTPGASLSTRYPITASVLAARDGVGL